MSIQPPDLTELLRRACPPPNLAPADVETESGRLTELARCAAWPCYFIDRYCHVYDNKAREWIDFTLWPKQREAVAIIHGCQRVVILKARQLGATWFNLGYILWSMLYQPIAKPLVFSRTEDDAMYLLGDERLRGMYKKLPEWMTHGMNALPVGDAGRTWELTNGSVAHAFPPNRGDSYTGTFAMADEFDVLTDKEQNQLLRSVKPTVDAGGKFVMLSRPDKTRPESVFKKTYKGARAGGSGWTPFFMAWHARPDRDEAWYEDQKRQAQSFPSPSDYLAEQYPSTDSEALAPASLDKRIPFRWLERCYKEMRPLPEEVLPPGTPAIAGLEVYVRPEPGRRYRIGADTSEGNPTSDPSALTVTDERTGEECCVLAGRFEPSVFAGHIDAIGRWYNDAAVMVERNNHGHAVILWLEDNSQLELLYGHDGKVGWMSSSKGKDLLYDYCATAFRDEDTILHSFATLTQLASVEGESLRAPEGEHEDRADSYALSLAPGEADDYTPDMLRN